MDTDSGQLIPHKHTEPPAPKDLSFNASTDKELTVDWVLPPGSAASGFRLNAAENGTDAFTPTEVTEDDAKKVRRSRKRRANDRARSSTFFRSGHKEHNR